MQPELEQQRAVAHQHLLEEGDPAQLAVELGGAAPAVGTPDQETGVPGGQVHPDAAPSGQGAPEAPVRRTLAFLVGGRAEGIGLQPPGVEPLVEALHGLALPGPVRPREHHDHRYPGLLQLQLGLEQARAKIGELLLVIALRDLPPQLGHLEHAALQGHSIRPEVPE